MTEPASAAAPEPTPPAPSASGSAPVERGWGKLLLAFAAFLLLPKIPQISALLPIENTMVLFVPALAACALVGWWAGGPALLAIAWIAIAALMSIRTSGTPDAFYNLARGWSLLLAGSFGMVCLFNTTRPLFARALVALGVTLMLALVMSVLGPVTMSQASTTLGDELTHRNREAVAGLDSMIKASGSTWQDLVAKAPRLNDLPQSMTNDLTQTSRAGILVFPALLALQSLAALALAWATYHRFSRARLGPPLKPLREFRFNDQLVWGLIVGLVIMLLPNLSALSGVGKNLLVFFGALYALRGLGVLSWFMAPGSLGLTLGVGLAVLLVPLLNAVVALGFVMLGIAALALGLGDTWADWRSRARPTSS
ncbi:MAG TPA: DUF2232 domain-containing protein [Gemmatimonadaceae bacterium]|jgi:hypothetical protein